MISNSSHYFCANVDSPAPAALVCQQAGCTVYPFLCGRATCTCSALHKKHHLQLLGGFLEELAVPLKLPEQLAKEHKDVDSLIGALIVDLQSLRKKHQEHLTTHVQGHRSFAGLAQKVLCGEQLEAKEATGDAFAKMLAEVDDLPKIKSPYHQEGEKLQTELRRLGKAAEAVLLGVEGLWKTAPTALETFTFSKSLKK